MVQPYHTIPAIAASQKRMIANFGDKAYEHHVGTVACSLLQHYFPLSNGYTITPEQIQYHKKRPDFVVEKLAYQLPLESGHLRSTLFVEIKRNKGDSWRKVMEQAANAAVFAADQDHSLATHVMIIRGKEVAFFEYYNYRTYLMEERVTNFHGLVPLTQRVPREQKESEGLIAISSNLPANVGTTLEFEVPYIFSLDLHQDVIHKLFNYLDTGRPRDHAKEY